MKSILICSLPGDYSGVPIYVRSIIDGLHDSYNFTLLTTNIDESFRSTACKKLVEPLIRNSFSPINFIFTIYTVAKILRGNKFDLIHLNGTLFGVVGRILFFIHRTPIIYTLHGLPWGPGRPFLINFILKNLERIFSKIPNQNIICISNSDLVNFKQGIPRRKVNYIPNAVQDNYENTVININPNPNVTSIFSVARFSKQKNHRRLFTAFSYLPSNFTLTLAGSGTDSESCISLAEHIVGEKSISRINFLGSKKHIWKHLPLYDIFVLSSDYEGMPLAALEAASAGRPIIMPRVGGANELNRYCGATIYEPNNSHALAKSIMELSYNKEKMALISRRARDGYKRQFSLPAFHHRMDELYKFDGV